MSCWCDETPGYKCIDCERIKKWRRLSREDKTKLLALQHTVDDDELSEQEKINDYKELSSYLDPRGLCITMIPAGI